MTIKVYKGQMPDSAEMATAAMADVKAGVSTMYDRQAFASEMHSISEKKKELSPYRGMTSEQAVSENLLERTRADLSKERADIAADLKRVRDDPIDIATTPVKMLESGFKSSEFYIKNQIALRAITKSASTIEQLARGG